MRPWTSATVGGALTALACGPGVDRLREADLAAAESLFRASLAAIRDGDTETYLSHYLRSPRMVAVGPDGPVFGFETLARTSRQNPRWPDEFEVAQLSLVWVAPGVVYGAYHVRQDSAPATGWSERLLVKTASGWKIAVTSVIPADIAALRERLQ